MSKMNEVWIESAVRRRVLSLCEKLGWHCCFKAWECDVWVKHEDCREGEHSTVHVTWNTLRDKPIVTFHVAAVGGFSSNGPFEVDVLEFALRRNAEIGGVHWCINRYDGLAVQAVRSFDPMSVDVFRDTVMDLLAERKEMIELAEKAVNEVSGPER